MESATTQAAPNAGQTAELLEQSLQQTILPCLLRGEPTHLIVAEKKPHLLLLPPLPGVPALQKAPSPGPQIRKPQTAPEKWRKDKYFGLVYVLQGEADLMLSKRIITCQADNLILLLPYAWRASGSVTHWIRDDQSPANCDLLWVFIMQHTINMHICRSRGDEHQKLPNLYGTDEHLMPLIQLLSDGVLSEPGSPEATQVLWLIFTRLLHKLRQGHFLPADVSLKGVAAKSHPLESVGKRAREYVDSHLAAHLDLESVARAVFVSRTTLAREFQKYTGENFGAYVLRRRIEQAQLLLQTTSLQIKEVAWYVGFSDADYFSTAFHRQTGITPTQFRKKTIFKEKSRIHSLKSDTEG